MERTKNLGMTIVGVALMLVAVGVIWSPLATFFAVDSCLDAGGSFDYVARVCDFEQTHTYAPTNNAARFSFGVALALSGVAVTIAARYGRRRT